VILNVNEINFDVRIRQTVEEIIYNFVNAIVLSLAGLFGGQSARRQKKKILSNRLASGRWKWRSFQSLCRAIREDEDTTRDLLIELGARASTKQKDMWTLDNE
jgi:hypothetical protein